MFYFTPPLAFDIFDHLQCSKIGDFVVVNGDKAFKMIELKVQSIIVCGSGSSIRAFCFL